MAIKI